MNLLMFMAHVATRDMQMPGVWATTCGYEGIQGHAASRTILIWVAYTVIWGSAVLQTRAAAEGHVWYYVPTASRI